MYEAEWGARDSEKYPMLDHVPKLMSQYYQNIPWYQLNSNRSLLPCLIDTEYEPL
jgi:hypothetical protein